MATTDNESSDKTKTIEDTFASPSVEQPQKPNRLRSAAVVGVAAAAGVGALLLIVGTMAGFVASRALDHGDRDDHAGMSIGRRISGVAAGEVSGDIPGRMMGGTVGKVTSVSSDSITLTDYRSGGSVTFKLDSNTDINDNKGDNAKVSDIKEGDTVSVSGTSASDDTLADTIVIDPTSRF